MLRPSPRSVDLIAAALLLATPLCACHHSDPPPIAAAPASRAPAAIIPTGAPAESKLATKLWDVPAFAFTDQDGKPFTPADLHGHVWVADYIFTHCTSACPVLTSKMKLVERQLGGADVRFLSFSVDPEHDTPAALKAYAAQWHLDESHWRLVAPPNALALRTFAADMQTEVMHSDDPANPILHSETIVLIDQKGAVRGRYDSTDTDDLKQLAADARQLSGSTAPIAAGPVATGSSADEGHQLADSLGCLACHAQAAVAPHLEGVAGSTVKLADGTTVTADAAYLRESILDPEKKVVMGYTATMPSYRGHLTDAQTDALVAFVTSLASAHPPHEAATAARIATVDPVCGMHISAGPESPSMTYEGVTYYFCSDACRSTFLADPKSHVPAPSYQ